MIPMCTCKVGPQHGSKYFTGIHTKNIFKNFFLETVWLETGKMYL